LDANDYGVAFCCYSTSVDKDKSFGKWSERIHYMKIEQNAFGFRHTRSTLFAVCTCAFLSSPMAFGQDKEKEVRPKVDGALRLDNSPKSLGKGDDRSGDYTPASAGLSSGGAFSFSGSSGQGGAFFGNGGIVFGGSASAFSGSQEQQTQQESPRYRSDSTGSRSAGKGGSGSMSASGIVINNGVTISQNVENVDGAAVKTTSIKDKRNEVTIVEREQEGITVTIRTPVKGKEDKVKIVEAEDADQLKKKSAEAYRWYKKYASGTIGSVAIQNGGAQAMAGGAAGNGNAIAGGGARGFGGPFPGNPAGNPNQAMMEQQLRQMILQSEDPAIRAQLQMLLDQMKTPADNTHKNDE
jgi:hypothetical protein